MNYSSFEKYSKFIIKYNNKFYDIVENMFKKEFKNSDDYPEEMLEIGATFTEKLMKKLEIVEDKTFDEIVDELFPIKDVQDYIECIKKNKNYIPLRKRYKDS
jgi:hypothetical protein